MKQNNIFFRYFSPVAAQQKLYAAALVALLSSSAYEAEAQVGEPFIHDPSTIALCDGKYYTFGTGEGGLWSKDGWTWQGGAVMRLMRACCSTLLPADSGSVTEPISDLSVW